jgi:cytolysin-activating lysine-acyltransferase
MSANEQSGPEFPTEDKLRLYGDFLFLAMRSAHHRQMNIANLHMAFEPPLELGQYKVFRFDGIPRGLLTWAWLGPEAERKFIQGGELSPDDWRSGDHMWLIDLIAPYKGLITGMSRWVMQKGNLTERDYYFRRVVKGNRTRRILHVDVTRAKGKAQVMQKADFAA